MRLMELNPTWACPTSKDFIFNGGDKNTNEWDIHYYRLHTGRRGNGVRANLVFRWESGQRR